MFGNFWLNAAMYVLAVAVSVGVQPHQLMVPEVALEESFGLSEPPQAARDTARGAAATAASDRGRMGGGGRRRMGTLSTLHGATKCFGPRMGRKVRPSRAKRGTEDGCSTCFDLEPQARTGATCPSRFL